MMSISTNRTRIRRVAERIAGLWKADTAQAVVELAFVLPVASFLLVGVLEIGRLANASIVLDHAARAGVQYGAQNRVTASDNAGMVQAAAQDASDIDNVTVTSSHFCSCSDGSSSTCQTTDCQGSRILEYVKVDAQAQMHTLLPYPGLPRSYAVKQQEIMRVSQ